MMEELKQLLQAHLSGHPAAQVQDAVKFLHQSFMGPGHLIEDEGAALSRLEEEWDRTAADPSAIPAQLLGGGLCRLDLSACKGLGLSPATVNRLFVLTAQEVKGDPEGLEQSLELAAHLPDAEAYLRRYRAAGCPMVRHSEAYRQAYRPAYRVVSNQYLPLLPLLGAIDRQLFSDGFARVALDGPCASGKSTLGTLLSKIYRCPLLHMDDFFLRPEQRTQERLAQPGGNVDRERFERDVLAPLCRGEAASYHPWRCGEGAFAPVQTIEPAPLFITEGSYSLHPDLRERYTLRIWVEAPLPVRLARLQERGGEEVLERYRTLWIPMEDRYFEACQVKACCQMIYANAR